MSENQREFDPNDPLGQFTEAERHAMRECIAMFASTVIGIVRSRVLGESKPAPTEQKPAPTHVPLEQRYDVHSGNTSTGRTEWGVWDSDYGCTVAWCLRRQDAEDLRLIFLGRRSSADVTGGPFTVQETRARFGSHRVVDRFGAMFADCPTELQAERVTSVLNNEHSAQQKKAK